MAGLAGRTSAWYSTLKGGLGPAGGALFSSDSKGMVGGSQELSGAVPTQDFCIISLLNAWASRFRNMLGRKGWTSTQGQGAGSDRHPQTFPSRRQLQLPLLSPGNIPLKYTQILPTSQDIIVQASSLDYHNSLLTDLSASLLHTAVTPILTK